MNKKFLLVSIILMTSAKADNLPWSQYQGNAAHTGFVPMEVGVPKKTTPTWTYSACDTGDCGAKEMPYDASVNYNFFQAIISDGVLYASTMNQASGGNIFALDLNSSHKLWQATLVDVTNLSPVSLVNDKLFLTKYRYHQNDQSSALYFYDAKTGASFRPIESKVSYMMSNPTVTSDGVYVQLDSVQIMGVNPQARIIEHTYLQKLKQNYVASNSYAVNNNYLAAMNVDEQDKFELNIFDRYQAGAPVMKIPVLQYFYGRIVFIDATKVALIAQDFLDVYDLQTKKAKYEIVIDSQDSVASDDQYIYTVESGNLTARDKNTGDKNWQISVSAGYFQPQGNIVVTSDTIFLNVFNNIQNNFYTTAVSKSTHQIVWSSELMQGIKSHYPMLSLADGYLVVANPYKYVISAYALG